jgi:dehydrogenase/reductase SDR family member 7B
MAFDFKNKVVWITGASSGIGEMLARQLAPKNCRLILSARRTEKLEAISKSLAMPEKNCLVLPLDLESKESVKNAVKTALEAFGNVDLLINNAGIAHKSMAEETLESVDRSVMEINFFGPVALSKALIEPMKNNGGGMIVAVSSILGEIGLPLVSAYAASKHAMNGYFNSLRYEVEKYNIKVCLIEPGFINTDITKKSLKGDGNVYNLDSQAQEKGMDAGKCAAGIIKAIEKEKRFAYVGGLETKMPLFELMFPRLFYFLMKKLHKI